MPTQRLNTLVEVVTVNGDPPVVTMTEKLWARFEYGISIGSGPSSGLRANGHDKLYTRANPPVWPGNFIRHGDRLWVVSRVTSDRAMGHVAIAELVGEPAVYSPASGGVVNVRVALLHSPGRAGSLEVASHERHMELARLDLNRTPARGDTITLRGTTWTVTGLVATASDGAVITVVVRQ